MISPQFYQSGNLISVFRGGRIAHYPHKKRTVTVQSEVRSLQYGDSLYSLAEKLFGDENELYWTILADNQGLRYPDDWGAGMSFKFPLIVLTDYTPAKTRYSGESTTTTPIPG